MWKFSHKFDPHGVTLQWNVIRSRRFGLCLHTDHVVTTYHEWKYIERQKKKKSFPKWKFIYISLCLNLKTKRVQFSLSREQYALKRIYGPGLSTFFKHFAKTVRNMENRPSTDSQSNQEKQSEQWISKQLQLINNIFIVQIVFLNLRSRPLITIIYI